MSTRAIAQRAELDAAAALLRAGAGNPAGVNFFNPLWKQPNWYIDPANSTGLASDSNSGATPSTPVLTWHAILNKLGTVEPILPQDTVFHFMSDQANNFLDPVILNPVSTNGGMVGFEGGLVPVGVAGILAGVVPKNRATGQFLTVNLGVPVAPLVGMMLENTTRTARCWIDSTPGGNVAVLTQPMASVTTHLPVRPPTNPALVDTFANGDAFIIKRPVKANLVYLEAGPNADSDLAVDSAYFYIQQLWGLDPGPAIGDSALAITPTGFVYESRFDRLTVFGPAGFGGTFAGMNNTWTAGNVICYATIFNGGSINPLGLFLLAQGISGGSALDGDVIVHGTTNVGLTIGGGNFIGLCALAPGALILVGTGSSVEIAAFDYGLSELWGTGTVEAVAGGGVLFDTSAVTQIAPTVTLSLDGFATGMKVVKATAVFTGGVVLTQANIDAADGQSIFNPQTGSRFAKFTS